MKGGGIGMATPAVYRFMKLTTTITQDNFPETLYKMFIINAPMLFSVIWSVAKVFIDKKTQNKISIIGGRYKKELLKVIDINMLPKFLGGKYRAVPNPNHSFWEQINPGPWCDPY